MGEQQGWEILESPYIRLWLPDLISGRFYSSQLGWAQGSVGRMSVNEISAIPFWVPNIPGVTLTLIGIEVTTGNVGYVTRLGIYSNTNVSNRPYPHRLILDAGTISNDAAGFQSIVISQFLRTGLYWLVGTASSSILGNEVRIMSGCPIDILSTNKSIPGVATTPASFYQFLGDGSFINALGPIFPDFGELASASYSSSIPRILVSL